MFKKPKLYLTGAMVIYIITIFGVCLWNYNNFLYNALDLAIFNQVFYNTSLGNWFELSIHPGSYLGDHFAPIILALTPIYFLFKSPLTLLFIQSLFLSLGALPIYLISKEVLKNKVKNVKLASFLLAAFYLINPFVANANLFEFHILTLAVPLVLFSFYFYIKNNFPAFCLVFLAALFVREDVALAIGLFGFLALIERKKIKWVLTPILAGGIYFFSAMKVISFFSEEGSYKFLYYYSWLGSSFEEIVKNFFIHPLQVINHIISLGNLEMILGFFLPFLFLPILRPKYLLLLLLPLAQIILGAPGGGELILQTHYSVLFIAPLFVSFIYGFSFVWQKISQDNKKIFIIILITAGIYSAFTLGPISAIFNNFSKESELADFSKEEWTLIEKIPNDVEVISSYKFLPQLSGRKNIYSLNYIFIGKQQFSDKDFPISDDVDYILIDFDDFITFNIQFPGTAWTAPHYKTGDDRIRKLLNEGRFGVLEVVGNTVLFKKNYSNQIKLYEIFDKTDSLEFPQKVLDKSLNGKIKFIGYNSNSALFEYQFFWQALDKMEKNYALQIEVMQGSEIIYKKNYPVAYGLYPSSEWHKNQIVKVNYLFNFPLKIKNALQEGGGELKFSLIDLRGYLSLNALRSSEEVISDIIILDYFLIPYK